MRIKSNKVGWEAGLEFGVFVKIVEDFFGSGVAFELDGNGHAFTVGLIAEIRDAFELFLSDQISNLGDETGFVDLVRELFYLNLKAAGLGLIDLCNGSDDYLAFAGFVHQPDLLLIVNLCACREIRTFDVV